MFLSKKNFPPFISFLVILAVIFTINLVDPSVSYSGDTLSELLAKGKQAYYQGDYDSAISFYNQALALEPNSAIAYNGLGLIYRDRNIEPSKVAWYFKVATDIDPRYVEALDNLGGVYLRAKDFENAEDYLKQALALEPDLLSAQFSLGWLYVQGKLQPDDAVYYFERVLEKRSIPSAYYGLGLAYAMMDNFPMVLEEITNLRNEGYSDLAAQLENMIRQRKTTQPAVPPEENRVANMKALQTGVVQQPVISGQFPQAWPGIDGSIQVRLKGKMYNAGAQKSGGNAPSGGAAPRPNAPEYSPNILQVK